MREKPRIIDIYSQCGIQMVDLDNFWSRLVWNANLLSRPSENVLDRHFEVKQTEGKFSLRSEPSNLFPYVFFVFLGQ